MNPPDVNKVSNALQLATLMALGGENLSDARRILRLWEDDELLGIARYAIKAPLSLRSKVAEAAAWELYGHLGGELEFWQQLIEWQQTEEAEFGPPVVGTSAPAAPAIPPRPMPIPPPPYPEDEPERKKPEPIKALSPSQAINPEKDQEFMRRVAPLRQGIQELLSSTDLALPALLREHPAPLTVSLLREISYTKVRTTSKPRTISDLKYAEVEQWLRDVRAALKGQPETQVPTAPTIIPTDHAGRIKLAAKFVVEHGGIFSLKELGEVLHIEDQNKVYSVLREVPGVRRMSKSEFKFFPA